MPRATVVVGLCGSGKSYHTERLHKQTGASVFEGVVEKQQIPEAIEWLRSGNDCIIEEISFCTAGNRAVVTKMLKQQVPGVEIAWFCLENDLDSANWNVRHRRNKGEVDRHLEINGRVSAEYSYPDGCEIVPITRIEA